MQQKIIGILNNREQLLTSSIVSRLQRFYGNVLTSYQVRAELKKLKTLGLISSVVIEGSNRLLWFKT